MQHARSIRRRDLLELAGCAGLTAAGGIAPLAASAQASWRPARPVRLVIPFPPSGSNDVLGRALAEGLAARLGQSVVVDNRPGAGGTIGAAYVARADPDGSTLLFISGNFAVSAAVQRLSYDPAADFTPVFQAAEAPMIVTVGRNSPARNLQDLIRTARENPGRLRFGATGVGDVNFFATQLLAAAAGIELESVVYRGIAEAQIDLMAGRIDLVITTMASARGLIEAGETRILAASTADRSPLLPNIATAKEQGVDYVVGAWWGVFAPARVSASVIAALHAEASMVARSESFTRILETAGAAHFPITQADFATKVTTDIRNWRGIAERLGITPT